MADCWTARAGDSSDWRLMALPFRLVAVVPAIAYSAANASSDWNCFSPVQASFRSSSRGRWPNWTK